MLEVDLKGNEVNVVEGLLLCLNFIICLMKFLKGWICNSLDVEYFESSLELLVVLCVFFDIVKSFKFELFVLDFFFLRILKRFCNVLMNI